jgi:hypothetical protein
MDEFSITVEDQKILALESFIWRWISFILSWVYFNLFKVFYVQSNHCRSLINPHLLAGKTVNWRMLYNYSRSNGSCSLRNFNDKLQQRYIGDDLDNTSSIYFTSFNRDDNNITLEDYQGFKLTLFYTFVISISLGIIWMTFVQFFP